VEVAVILKHKSENYLKLQIRGGWITWRKWWDKIYGQKNDERKHSTSPFPWAYFSLGREIIGTSLWFEEVTVSSHVPAEWELDWEQGL
jgi:hypothetical protein